MQQSLRARARPGRALVVAALLLVAGQAARAHVSYTNRNLGTFSGLAAESATLSNQAVTGNFGWADATDADYGDSHHARAFRFTLLNPADVAVTVAANPDATATSLGGLLPGFSVYGGLAHLPPAAADHDFAVISQSWLATTGAPAKEGAWMALGDWKMGSDTGTTFTDLSTFLFRGYAVDGNSAKFGNAPGIVGDGVADGTVTANFRLAAGDYSIFIGGADYAAQDPGNPNVGSSYGLRVTLNVTAVPEPDTRALFTAGLAFTGLLGTRRLRHLRRT